MSHKIKTPFTSFGSFLPGMWLRVGRRWRVGLDSCSRGFKMCLWQVEVGKHAEVSVPPEKGNTGQRMLYLPE